ncbi:MAG: ferritin-like domain-containing protein [Gemmatimonadota bacterium]|nr:ferritin-like domain-containing protein [Gemmatimonadota bacterium]
METNHLPDDLEPEITERLVTRREAILRGARVSSALAAGLTLGSAPVATAALAQDAFAQDGLPESMVEVLNFGLLLEHLAIDFYTRALGAPGLLTGDTRPVFEQILKHEAGHARFLQSVLRDRAIPRPAFDFTGGNGRGNGPFADVFRNRATFLALSQAFEDLGVKAVKGQAGFLLPNDALLQAGLRIHSVEARHAAEVRRLRGQKAWITGDSRGDLPAMFDPIYDPEDDTYHFVLAPLPKTAGTTEAFDQPMRKRRALDILSPFLAGERP